jgi:hypothetical protein
MRPPPAWRLELESADIHSNRKAHRTDPRPVRGKPKRPISSFIIPTCHVQKVCISQ